MYDFWLRNGFEIFLYVIGAMILFAFVNAFFNGENKFFRALYGISANIWIALIIFTFLLMILTGIFR